MEKGSIAIYDTKTNWVSEEIMEGKQYKPVGSFI